MVTVLLVPTFLSANVPIALTVLSVTTSGDTTPTRVAPPVFRVAAVLPL